MTEEKEIAEKVWGWFEKEVRSALKNDDGIPYEGTMALIETNLEKILPRPKKKVRVKKERWISISKNMLEDRSYYTMGSYCLYDKKEEVLKYEGHVVIAKVTFEVEEDKND